MKHNVGSIDKAIRIVAGLALIGWGLYAQSWWGALGAVPLLTALIGWCPAAWPLGLCTVKDKSDA